MDQSLLLLPPLQEVLKTVQERQLKILSNTVLHTVHLDQQSPVVFLEPFASLLTF